MEQFATLFLVVHAMHVQLIGPSFPLSVIYSMSIIYRMSHIGECKVNQLWGVEGSIISLNYHALWIQEVLKWVSSTSFQKSNIGWPQQPPTKKFLKLNMIFHDSTENFFYQNLRIKLNSKTWMTLNSSVVIFQAL